MMLFPFRHRCFFVTSHFPYDKPPHKPWTLNLARRNARSRFEFLFIRTWSLATERVCVRSGFPVCTCPSVGAFCTPLFALHLVLTLQSAFFVCFLRTSLRRMSFEIIGFGDDAHFAQPGFRPYFFVSLFASFLELFLMDFGSIFESFFWWVFIFWL